MARYPNIKVQLTGTDSNTFIMVSKVRSAMKRAGVPEDACVQFFNEALSGNADHALQTCMAWVDVS